MARKKKSDVVEFVEPMKDDAMNLPSENVDEDTEKVSENVESTENVVIAQESVEEKSEEITEQPLTSVPRKMKINSSSTFVNIREKPDGDVMFFLKNNTPIIVEEEHDGWCKVSGWVMSALVSDR